MSVFKALKERIQLFKLQRATNLRKKLLGKNVIGLLNETAIGPMLVDPLDHTIGKQLADHGDYEPGNRNSLLSRLTTDSRVCVIGAHVGIFLIPIARKVKAVLALEANPNTHNLLQINLKINDIDNVQLFNYAAGDSEKMIEFYVSRNNSGGSKIKPEKEHYEFTYDNPEIIEVKMVRTDDLTDDHNFDMVVMDIEGAEYFALQGMPKILATSKFLHIEFIPNHLRKVAQVTNKQFLDVFADYFDKAKIMYDQENITYNKDQFPEMLQRIESVCDQYSGKDILFSKEGKVK